MQRAPESSFGAGLSAPLVAAFRPSLLGRAAAVLPVLPAAQLPSQEFLRTLFGNAALLLIVGGLAVLGLIVVLLLLQSLFPAKLREDPREPEALRPQLRPISGAPSPSQHALSQRLKSGRVTRRPVVDQALDQVLHQRVGEPRLLRHRAHYSLVRVYACRSCEGTSKGNFRHKVEGCPYERAAIETAFQGTYGNQSLARETACRRWGDAACEYEVRH